MCGIFGYVGKEEDVGRIVFEGLQELEYRGYDSWGIGVAVDGQIDLVREVGKLPRSGPVLAPSGLALGHTRWATTGAVTLENAHPHLGPSGRIAIVHNGIVENFSVLRDRLVSQGVRFSSDTDSEIIAYLVEEYLAMGISLVDALAETLSCLTGHNAFVVLDVVSGVLAAVRSGSPLYVGIGDNSLLVASDAQAFVKYTNKVVRVGDGQIVELRDSVVRLWDAATGCPIAFSVEEVPWAGQKVELGQHQHYLAKEIYEQPELIRQIASREDLTNSEFSNLIAKADRLVLFGCGTAYHACVAGSYLFSQAGNQNQARSAQAVYAHEMQELVKGISSGRLAESIIGLALSQSGETIDVLDAVKVCANEQIALAAMVNVPGSSLTYEVGSSFLLEAGPERSVLSTKVFAVKIATLSRLAHSVTSEDLLEISQQMSGKLEPDFLDDIFALARELVSETEIFVIGSGLQYPLAMETALKIKEGSYIHAEAFPSGELKHGVLALVSKGTPCIVFVPEGGTGERALVAAGELAARGARVIGVSGQREKVFTDWLEVKGQGVAYFLNALICMQMLAYKLAVFRDLDPDKPRNLAKSVTVR